MEKDIVASSEILHKLINELSEKKEPFLIGLREEIKDYVSSQDTLNCLTLVSKKIDSEKHELEWKPTEGYRYGRKFITFIRKSNYVEKNVHYRVDSILTSNITKIITKHFSQFYQENQELVVQHLAIYLLEEGIVADALVNAAVKESKIVDFAKKEVKAVLNRTIIPVVKKIVQDAAKEVSSYLTKSAAVKSVETAVKMVGTTIATQGTVVVGNVVFQKALVIALRSSLAKAIAKVVTELISTKFMVAVGELLLTIPFHKIVDELVVVVLIGNFLLLIAEAGIVNTSTITAIILMPIFAWIMYHEYKNFPSKIGKSISKSMFKELDKNFNQINTKTFASLVETSGKELAKNLGILLFQDADFKAQIKTIMNAVNQAAKVMNEADRKQK
ncbi:MAG: hypothetical protein GDA56_12770 [Hormoscilla sp. GM7CHS1pb]|nr:hypothetical protein [Hormoscilla sp. GM7CHS1pb]